MDKLISVIIPAYNSEKTIKKTIESVVGENIEIVVVIDGATDNTLKVCKSINNCNLKIIEQENKGAFEARKTGIKNAIGKYIMFLDADDCFKINTISRMKDIINKYKKPDLIRFRYERVPNGYEQYAYFKEDEKEILRENFKDNIYPMFLNGYMLNSVWCNCVKREIIQKIDINTKINYGEDLILNLELFSNIKNAVFINEVLYEYTYSQDSITTTKSFDKLLKNLDNAIEVYSLLYKYLLKWNMYNENNIEIVNKRIKKEADNIIEIIKSIKTT